MSQIDDLPPLREVIERHGLQALKSLGQNFLLDLNLTARIARTAGRIDDLAVVEVGPGPGGLTRALLAVGAGRVVAVERDRRAIAALEEVAAHYPGRLDVIEGDALAIDTAALGDGPVAIVANLPYNIATPLLTGWLSAEPWPPRWRVMVLMFQKEVADRITAAPGDDAYGRLAVLTGWRAIATQMFDISPKAFVPPPKVTSTVVHFEPRPAPLPCRRESLEAVTAAAFGQRRKMLRQSLKALGVDVAALVESAGLDPTVRAETVPVAGFVALANAWDKLRGGRAPGG
ncbi:16S rRNA (adenine(1518)-N(6)/adenine(1519)-N(6))-dimethyltransferase RsmA [Oharaeibacter diazotrophicus]|uniref:Ribosomal RNA small subunit methyltransferase A n=1 Tax=Oharaeibacter diazotrophicus TaxID=1920512 RepID=A0A4R6RKZ3_9HYPH|nr:16S rRNA (adenine(1518)-N(6)/adenine(1519)-N(6))-dimethyltransferase RsmA [Oharaeibacter diazotrophicus]TDP86765.1 dimethyladenosine transferase [Oharaeibacter diazotrophicus]BBE71292.1 ribosomal RNA small subunit methyltransferase A [Pleomorphomonas sp. SM30]GLS78047.1 ribosomal RNA small subunit methyltransferase A [Oharaeibacter diazotrophicus]